MEIIKTDKRETIGKITEIKSWFFEKINKIDQFPATLIKEKEREQKAIIGKTYQHRSYRHYKIIRNY